MPVKSLLRFRSVSKSWLSSTSCPEFVKTHLSIASKSRDYTHHSLILSSTHPQFNVRSCSLNSLLNEELDNMVELDYPDKDPNHCMMIVGSCNGLVCIGTDWDSIFIWNPSTGQSKRLPSFGFSEERGGFTMRFGFGCGESDYDYKVVVIFSDDGSWGSCETRVEVYTLKTDSWKRIGDFAYGIPTDYTGKFANGLLHWLAPGEGSGYTRVIASLDLAKEMYGEVLLPNYDDLGYGLQLFVSSGCLGALCVYPETRADVWIRKEYSVRDSWTKLFTIPYHPVPWMNDLSTPLCISKNGEILMYFGQQLGLYSLENETFRKLLIPNLCPSLQLCTYVGSLVSPNSHHMVQRQHQKEKVKKALLSPRVGRRKFKVD